MKVISLKFIASFIWLTLKSVVNVDLDILGNTFVANSKHRGNHWICIVIDIIKAKIYYYDSLSLKISLNLHKAIEFIIALVKDCYQYLRKLQKNGHKNVKKM